MDYLLTEDGAAIAPEGPAPVSLPRGGAMLASRRRHIRARGRAMVLRKVMPNAPMVDVALIGFARAYRPEEIEGAIKPGHQRVEILNDELAAAGFGPPANPQKLRDAATGATIGTLGGATPVYEGAALIGWSLWVTG